MARLRRWVRATDEEGRPCKFGFAEYEDILGLECGIEVLKDLEIPAIDERKEVVKLTVCSVQISTYVVIFLKQAVTNTVRKFFTDHLRRKSVGLHSEILRNCRC